MDGLVAPAAGTNPQLGLHSSEGFGLQGSLTDAAGYTAQQARSVEARQVGRAYQQRRVSGRGGGGEREGAGRRVLGLGGGSWGREEEEVWEGIRSNRHGWERRTRQERREVVGRVRRVGYTTLTGGARGPWVRLTRACLLRPAKPASST